MSSATESAKELALVAARAADDKQGLDIAILDVSSVLAITEVFVITSASNSRQVKTIASEVTDKVRETLGRSPLHSEGAGEQQWVLLDYGDVVVHVFADEARRFYEIERLYLDMPKIAFGPVVPKEA
ncbi:MAG: ribosome silencing factor [Ilumatobacteraceae bacterium]